MRCEALTQQTVYYCHSPELIRLGICGCSEFIIFYHRDYGCWLYAPTLTNHLFHRTFSTNVVVVVVVAIVPLHSVLTLFFCSQCAHIRGRQNYSQEIH